ncbi:hypothetical protein [Methylorubrum sp. DB1722]|uniref:hypothetical protein n=1 Tax=Methylorubrum sp. DB1722 TaxID=2478916 RepID=UPI0018E3C0EB|nr:hypothetical protein [Methylorubrum sp. DB1722]MBI1689528.1 hypothetical protein [Methylorubrum sp. DB1722]
MQPLVVVALSAATVPLAEPVPGLAAGTTTVAQALAELAARPSGGGGTDLPPPVLLPGFERIQPEQIPDAVAQLASIPWLDLGMPLPDARYALTVVRAQPDAIGRLVLSDGASFTGQSLWNLAAWINAPERPWAGLVTGAMDFENRFTIAAGAAAQWDPSVDVDSIRLAIEGAPDSLGLLGMSNEGLGLRQGASNAVLRSDDVAVTGKAFGARRSLTETLAVLGGAVERSLDRPASGVRLQAPVPSLKASDVEAALRELAVAVTRRENAFVYPASLRADQPVGALGPNVYSDFVVSFEGLVEPKRVITQAGDHSAIASAEALAEALNAALLIDLANGTPLPPETPRPFVASAEEGKLVLTATRTGKLSVGAPFTFESTVHWAGFYANEPNQEGVVTETRTEAVYDPGGARPLSATIDALRALLMPPAPGHVWGSFDNGDGTVGVGWLAQQ